MSRTLLIGLDGATFTLLDPLMADGTMPGLRALAENGVRAELLSTPNPLTPPAWTSLATGRTPGAHGIFDFVRVTRAAGAAPPQYTIATARDVRAETVWSIAARQGMRATVLNFPVMFPPRPIDGYVVPGFVPWRHLRRFVWPPELYGELQALPRFRPAELLLNLDLERDSLQTLPREQYADWIRLHLRREEQWFEIVRHLMTAHPCDLTAVIFDGVDKLQHLCWPFLDPALAPADPEPWEREVRGLCLEYFRRLDAFIQEMVALAGPGARVFLASDHGFGPTDEIFYVNAWLERQGLLAWAPGAAVDHDGRQMTEGHRNPTILFDWNHTTAYALTAGSNGIYIRVSENGGPGVPAAGYAAFRDRLADALRGFADPATGAPVVRQVLTRDQAFPGPEMERAPDLTLVLRDYGFVSVLPSDRLLRPRARVAGTHRPEGIFVAAGEGIRAGERAARLGVHDVAALLLYSLGLPVPEDLEGSVPTDVFEAVPFVTDPPRWGPPTLPPDPFFTGAGDALPADAEAQVMARLQALGYLE